MNSSQHVKTIRIGLIITIIAGFTVGALNGLKVREKIRQLQANLQQQTTARNHADLELARVRQELGTAVVALNGTKAALQAVTAEKESALTAAAANARRAEHLAKDLAASRQDRDLAQAELARFRAAGIEPEQISKAAELIRKLQKELGVAQAMNKELNLQVVSLRERLDGEFGPVKLPAGLDGKVLVYDPRWQFVVLDAGQSQGVVEYGELLVSRGGELVAKVVVTRVEKDRCVATVKPGWRLGEIVEGDRVVAAHPRS